MKPVYDRDGIQIWHGDCRDVLPRLERESVRLLWTDPPYGHGNQDGDLQASRVRDGVKGARVRPVEIIANDTRDSMRETVDAALTLCEPLMIRDCCCCCCAGGGGPNVTFAWLANRMDTSGLQFFHAVVWDKSGRGHGLGWRFRRDYEFVMVGHKKGGKLAWANDDKAVPNILFVDPTKNVFHPTEKPVALVSYFINLTTGPNDLILDPFGGSGTTAAVAEHLGCDWYGCELNPEYARLAEERIAAGWAPKTPKQKRAKKVKNMKAQRELF